jgi:hypothetical protein
MTRQEKYPETSTFHYHNQNPHGRITTDCVTRAISTATEIPYNQVVTELAEMQCKTGYDSADAKLYDRYLASKGWIKHKQPRKPDGTKYTGKEWCLQMQEDYDWVVGNAKNMIAHIGGHHAVAIIDGKVWDIWDSTGGSIGNYWTEK